MAKKFLISVDSPTHQTPSICLPFHSRSFQQARFIVSEFQKNLIKQKSCSSEEFTGNVNGVTVVTVIGESKEAEKRIWVVDISGKTIGLTVDKVTQVMKLNASQISQPPELLRADKMGHISGIGQTQAARAYRQ
jgi:hypothetical protein